MYSTLDLVLIQVWAPYFKKYIDVLETVQRRAAKLVRCTKNLSYEQKLEYLGLYSLSRRRRRGDLIETYKILRNIEDIGYMKSFVRSDTVQLRGHNYKLHKNIETMQNVLLQPASCELLESVATGGH